MTRVFVLHHTRDIEDEEDSKLIGVYSSEANAKAAAARLSEQSGFRDHPDGFTVDPYDLDADHWTEGFASMVVIYVRLLDEGVDVWRPVHAERISRTLYRIVEFGDHPEDETWEYNAGDTVRCEHRAFEDGASGLAAVASGDAAA